MRTHLALFASVLLLGVPAQAAEPGGVWLSQDGESKIRIAPCGPKLCGTLVWLSEPNDATGKPLLDANNADAAARARPLLGVQILQGLSRSGDAWKGKIYNPDDGKTYEGSFGLSGADKAEIKGCVAAVFCQTEILLRQ